MGYKCDPWQGWGSIAIIILMTEKRQWQLREDPPMSRGLALLACGIRRLRTQVYRRLVKRPSHDKP